MKQLKDEIRKDLQECFGSYCKHERLDTHYILGEDEVISVIDRCIEETRTEMVEKIKGMKVKIELEEPNLFQNPPTPNAKGGYSSVPFYCSLCFMGEMDIQDNKLENGNYHCSCSEWTNSCGGKWVKWYDEVSAKKFAEEMPTEETIKNKAIDDIIKSISKDI